MLLESRVDRRRLEFWFWAVIVLGLFAYVWQGIGTHLLYHGFGVFTAYPALSWEGSFLRTSLVTPGGVVASLAALLAQMYRIPVPGALIITAALAVLALGMRRLLHSVQADRLRDLAWLPALLALAIYNQYDDPLPILVAIGVSLWMAILFGWIPAKTLPIRMGAFLVLFSLTYHVAGATALLFAFLVCLIEALTRRRVVVALAQTVLACGGAHVLGRFLYDLSPVGAYTVGTPWDSVRNWGFSPLSDRLAMGLYALAPSLLLLGFLARVVTANRKSARPPRKAKDAQRISPSNTDARLAFGLRLFLVAGAGALCLAVSRNHLHNERALHYWASQRDWDRVIAMAHRMRGRGAFTPSGVFDINRALAHRGRLGEELCVYPQDETRTLFLSFENMAGRFQHAKLIELYLDLGCPNAAEKNAYELLDNEGPSPHVLEAMVRIHLVKGQHESARIAFEALRKHAGCGVSVRRWRDVIADPALAQADPRIQAWRQAQGTENHAVAGVSFESMLKGLLQEKPGHRLAFEYLMAHFLLKHQRAEFIGFLPLLRPLGYAKLPRQYAEAMLVYALETKKPMDEQGWTIEPAVHAQFREIMSVVRNARGNTQAVFDTLAQRYGDSYTFYSMFNICGVK
jgi:hypothetical protein